MARVNTQPWGGTVDSNVLKEGLPDAPPPRLLTKSETLRYLKISNTTLFRRVHAGEITPIRIGVSVRFDLRDLNAWVDRMRAQQGLPV